MYDPKIYKAWYDARRAAGMCTRCTNESEDGGVYCRWCRQNVKEGHKDRRERRIRLALCAQCGVPGMGAYVTCETCRAKHLAAFRLRKQRKKAA